MNVVFVDGEIVGFVGFGLVCDKDVFVFCELYFIYLFDVYYFMGIG